MSVDLVPAPMTVDEARSVAWPFRDYKGQSIGSLFDTQAVTLKDLAFAYQRAYNKRVRDAAKTLLLDALTRQTVSVSPVGPLNVVSSDRRSFAERRQIQLALIEGAFLGVLLGGALFAGLQMLLSPREPDPQSTQSLEMLSTQQLTLVILVSIAFVAIGVFIFLFQMNWISNRIERELRSHRKGQLGEERLLNALYRRLDGNWWLFRNLELPGKRHGDIDFVLVGPNGVWSLEVKAWEGNYRNIGQQWERSVGSRWLPAFGNPTRQAKRNAATIHHILQTHNIKQWITPVVVWVNPDSKLVTQNPDVLVWKIDQLANDLATLHKAAPIYDAQRKQIIDVFKSLYKQSDLPDAHLS